MSTGTPANITGSDGVVPVENPDGLWAHWALQQLFMGADTPGATVPGGAVPRWVGKVNDYVTNYDTDERWKITALDVTTLKPTLTSITPVITPGDLDTTDLLFGVGPGTDADTYRCYIDQSVIPYKLVVDQRLSVNSVLTKYAKIFQGSQLDGTAQVISAFYDTSGNFLGDSVPLELVSQPNAQNYAVKTVQPCYTKVPLANNDKVTVVFYGDDGGVVSTRQLLVMNTAFIRSSDASLKYVVGITLDSPFLSSADANTIQFPINVPIVGWNLFGVVHYSDGSKLRMPVDGTKFKVMGLRDFVATIVGQEIDFTLQYTFSPDEVFYDAQTGSPTGDKFKNEPYKAIVQNSDGSYTVKLFCVPHWDTATSQYFLDWYLYDLDRALSVLVTPYVTYQSARGFDGTQTGFGLNQSVQVAIDLSNVNGQYKKYIFTQTLQIVLMRAATDHSGDPWVIYYSPSQAVPYGTGLKAKVNFINQNLKYVDVSQGATDQASWLNAILPAALPLFDPQAEPTYPTPNMFSFIQSDGTEAAFPISQWNAQNAISTSLPDGATLYLKFFERTPENDLQIAMCPMVIQQTD
jgi:hypothetical protein